MSETVTINGIPINFLPKWDSELWKDRLVLLPKIKDSEVEPDGREDRQSD